MSTSFSYLSSLNLDTDWLLCLSIWYLNADRDCSDWKSKNAPATKEVISKSSLLEIYNSDRHTESQLHIHVCVTCVDDDDDDDDHEAL